MNFVIRPGKYEDCHDIFAISFAEDGHLEVPSYNTLKLNPEKLWKVVPYWMESESGMIYVAEKHGKVIGYIFGEIFQPWSSNDTQNIIHILYVSKKYRNSTVGIKLLDHFLEETKKRDIDNTIMCMMYSSENLEGMDKVLKKRGFAEVAKYYQRNYD